MKEYWMGKTDIVLPDKVIPDQYIQVKEGRIHAIQGKPTAHCPIMEMDGQCYAFPGLINGHDHLLGSYLPRIENKKPYLNWQQWDEELKASSVYMEMSQISHLDLYLLGCFRHLFSGVFTVLDHVPHQVNIPLMDKLPVRLIRNYSLMHDVVPFHFQWGTNAGEEYQKAAKHNWPFITYLEAGFDEESRNGTALLKRQRALGSCSVLIHGLSLSDEDIHDIAEAGASIVLCPYSSFFLFESYPRIQAIMGAGINTCLGTGSVMGGGFFLLDEMRLLQKMYLELYKQELSEQLLFRMVTVNAAKALKIDNELGLLKEGNIADICFLPKKSQNPYKDLLQTLPQDFSLLIYQGQPVVSDEKHAHVFELFSQNPEIITWNAAKRYVFSSYSVAGVLEQVRKSVGFHKKIDFLPVD